MDDFGDFGDFGNRDFDSPWNDNPLGDMYFDAPLTPKDTFHDDMMVPPPKFDPPFAELGQISHRRVPSQPTVNSFTFFQQAHVRTLSNSRRTQRTFEPSHDRQFSLPLPLPPTGGLDMRDEEFNDICNDPKIVFNPHKLGFIPSGFWPDQEFTFGQLVRDFFQRKNNANSRFFHKLFNALKISESDPFYAVYLGVEWVNETVLKVDKKVFARLLSIKTIDGSLFHQQGNFPSHGFVEIKSEIDKALVSPQDLEGVDYDNVRLLYHQPGIFKKGCGEEVVDRCKWTSARRR